MSQKWTKHVTFPIVRWVNEKLTITDAVGRLRGNDQFLTERLFERDVTVRKLVAQVNYLTELTQRWAREYPVLQKIEVKHLKLTQERRDRALARASLEAKKAATLPHGTPLPLDDAELAELAQAAKEHRDA